jgi:hypothetical protein
VLEREQITYDYRKGGVLCAPPAGAQLGGLRDHRPIALGLNSEHDYRWLTPFDKQTVTAGQRLWGDLLCLRPLFQPAKLVRGLARCVEAMGVELYGQAA